MNEMKSCPFCGGVAKIGQTKCDVMDYNSLSARFDFSIRCKNCDATAPNAYGFIAANLSSSGELIVWHDDRPKAIAAWNRRPK